MNVSGIRPYDGFYQYNSIKLNEQRNQQIAASMKISEQNQEMDDSTAKVDEAASVSALPVNQNFDSYDYAQQYRPDETFELKGTDSDINNLDAQKAVSDLDKDQVLQQYQYFVGDVAHLTVKEKNPLEASIRMGENFSL